MRGRTKSVSHGSCRSSRFRAFARSMNLSRGFITHSIGAMLWVNLVNASTDNSILLAEFMEFINKKPTVEILVFQADPRRFAIVGGDSQGKGTLRRFQFVGEQDQAFSLFEDTSTSAHGPLRGMFWGRYRDLFWHRFNANDVFTETSNQQPGSQGSYGPALGTMKQLGLAYDLLNLGIFELGTNGVVWNGLTFSGKSCESGYSINGRLVLGDDGMPRKAQFTNTPPRSKSGFAFEAVYTFDPRDSVPAFFPTSVRITSSSEPTMLVASYEVQKLLLSQRHLEYDDVDYAGYLTPDSVHYLMSNAIPYRLVSSHGAQSLRRMGPPSGGQSRPRLLFGFVSLPVALMVFVLTAPLIFAVYRWSQRRKQQ